MKSGYTQKIWDDPVWSKIISAGIIPVIGVIWFYLKSWWPFSRYKSQTSPVPVSKVFIREKSGFDHGAGHPLLFMDDAKAPNCLKNNDLKDLGNYSEWPKVAVAVIKASLADGFLHQCDVAWPRRRSRDCLFDSEKRGHSPTGFSFRRSVGVFACPPTKFMAAIRLSYGKERLCAVGVLMCSEGTPANSVHV